MASREPLHNDASSRVSPPPNPHDVDRLLDRLGTDDAFRREFMRAPHDALASLKFDSRSLTRLPPVFGCAALASKDVFASARDLLRAQRMSRADLTKPPDAADGIRPVLR